MEQSLWVVLMYAWNKKEERLWSESGVGYLPGGRNEVKRRRRWNEILLVVCCGWVVILGGACVEIYWEWELGQELDGQRDPMGAKWATSLG